VSSVAAVYATREDALRAALAAKPARTSVALHVRHGRELDASTEPIRRPAGSMPRLEKDWR